MIEPLSAEDCAVQSMPDASPAKWHLAHTSWFFETVVLKPHLPGYRQAHPRYAYLFNSYYNSLGERHARPQRGLLTRPSLDEVLAYRRHVDTAMAELLAAADAEAQRLTEIGLQHEQQHQELLLTDIKHALSCNPLLPAYREGELNTGAVPALSWQQHAAGLYEIGHAGQDFAYDNETPRHPIYLQDFAIASRLVSNGEFQSFMDAGGYAEPDLWLSDGWDWIQQRGIDAPLYWQQQDDGRWQEFTLLGPQPLHATAPACHLSFYEADAYARWAGARLPSEAEWEVAAPIAAPSVRPAWHPLDHDWYGQTWQWTVSAYQPYPGYRPPQGPLGEYNAKFMCNQLVLRGSSCFTSAGHARRSYRNFFYPQSRWQMTGLRLAKDL